MHPFPSSSPFPTRRVWCVLLLFVCLHFRSDTHTNTHTDTHNTHTDTHTDTHTFVSADGCFFGSRSKFHRSPQNCQSPEEIRSNNITAGYNGTLTVNTTSIPSNGSVTLTWDVRRPSTSDHPDHHREGDFIAVYCPPPSDDTSSLNDFLDAVPISEGLNNTLTLSSLLGMRCDYSFLYIDGATRVALARSQDVRIDGGHAAPTQVRLSLTNHPGQVNVMWVTNNSDVSPCVRAVDSEEAMTELYRDPGWQHLVTLTGLVPGEPYTYTYGSALDGWGAAERFIAPPARADHVTFATVGDMATPDQNIGSQTTIDRMVADVEGGGWNYSFVLHQGDLSYGMGNGFLWERWGWLISPLAATVPYQAGIGNHELDDVHKFWHPKWGNYFNDSLGECGVPTYVRHVTTSVNSSNYASHNVNMTWYSFDYASLVHVVMLNSELDWTVGSDQYNWFVSDLAAVNRTNTPWVVVTSHRPVYCSERDIGGEREVIQHLRETTEPILNKYQVDLVLTGHMHDYERTCPVYKGECVAAGTAPTYVIVGTGGANLETGDPPFPNSWCVSHVIAFGYGRAHVTRHKLTFQFVLNSNGTVFDEFTLEK
eukprot:TRINITY_DN6385_c0_g1_i1.p1 TRINITY_DN6385_c0_g1~~TRINITY_DN6385_c0_g1_i1.p1  ORF type:complete len:594 (-),score=90.51 TRINITY_DN6385_c0_g1_i1:4-1785(-)